MEPLHIDHHHHIHLQKHSHEKRHPPHVHHHHESPHQPLDAREILPRDTDSSDCDPDVSSCRKPTSNNNALVIALSVAIPVVLFLIVMGILYRRSVKKRRLEDMNDRTRSLDFGMGDQPAKKDKNGRPAPQMTKSEAYQVTRSEKGVSMDLGLNNPYLLPPVVQGSRDSFNSLSRTTSDPNDPYRPSAFARSDNASLRAAKTDNGSLRVVTNGEKDAMNLQLLRNAQQVPSSTPPPPFSASSTPINSSATPPPPFSQEDSPAAPKQAYKAYAPSTNQGLAIPALNVSRDSYAKQIRQSNEYLAAFITDRTDSAHSAAYPASGPSSDPKPPPPVQKDFVPSTSPPNVALPEVPPLAHSGLPSNPRPHQATIVDESKNIPTVNILPAAAGSQIRDDYGDTAMYGSAVAYNSNYNSHENTYNVTSPSPPLLDQQQTATSNTQMDDSVNMANLNVATYDTRRLSMGLRPLPPEDPSDNPEQRANRIRSFYKEYFDETKPDPFGYYDQVPYYEDYGYGEYNPYDQAMQPPAAPYAQGMGRRAMTPPPRKASRFHGASRPVYSGSAGDMTPPRAASSMSGRNYGGPRGQPKKRLPPPAPLMTLPTPHRLRNDSTVYGVLDYAPPTSFRDRQAGRPDSPLGAPRPYSPSVRAHLPLASSYDDLNVMPSPHHLRKSGTFTALDFAPPPRFRNADNTSDAGSIRSNRSGISAVQQNALRAGVHRVSRIPRELGGTRQEINNQLRPTWEMRGPNPQM